MIPSTVTSFELREKVIAYMRKDNTTATVCKDPTIQEYGQRLLEKLGKTHKNYISQKMRELAKFVNCMRNKKKQSKMLLGDILTTSNFDNVLEVCKTMAGFSKAEHQYNKPSIAVKLGITLKKCALILRNKAIRESDEEKKTEMNNFLELMTEFGDRISSRALSSAEVMKYNNCPRLPLTRDIVKLMKYIKTKAATLMNSIQNYTEYAKVILAWLIIFNRKRAGEAQQILMKDLPAISKSQSVSDDVADALSKFEVMLCQTMFRLETRGKRGRKVAILFTTEMRDHVMTLSKMRTSLPIQSPYLFARCPSDANTTPLRGSDALRECATAAECEEPSLIQSTRLRKQLATLVQVLNLRDNEMDMVADFLGHDIRIHRKFYRLSEDTLQAAKITKLLHAANSGNMSKFKNMNFDEIDVDDSLEAEDSEDELDECSEADMMDKTPKGMK